MGVCESKDNLVSHHISQHSIEKLSENPAETAKLKAIQHNHLIDKAKHIIDAANDKIRALQDRCKDYKLTNGNLETELNELKRRREEKDEITKKYKDQLDVQRETMLKWKEKIQTLSEEIVSIEQERKENDFKYKNNLLSITDSLYKVHGDNISKLKFNKQSKKIAIFTNKVNHLFYYDEHGAKFIVIRDISVRNEAIEKQMSKAWFLVIGDKRSALFATDNQAIRDKWLSFIQKSLNKQSNDDEYDNFDYSQSTSAINPIYSVDNTLQKELNDKLGTKKANHHHHHTKTNHTNQQHVQQHVQQDQFGISQSPINIISNVHSKHTKVMTTSEFESNPLRFNYPSKIAGCSILNNGHTVQININNSKCSVLINNQIYELKQFHFHTPSEHTIDGKQYEMEMHLVHINSRTNQIAVLGFIFTTQQKYKKPKLELTKSRAHLVLSKEANINYKNKNKLQIVSNQVENDYDKFNNAVDDESDDMETDDEWEEENNNNNNNNNNKKKKNNRNVNNKKGNDFLSQFWDELPSKKTDADILLSKPLTFDYLFETSSNNFSKNIKTNAIDIDMEIFEYMGSLTTPPFTEGVQWMVSKTTHSINQKQLKKLSACWGNENNARPVQDYFGRTVSLRSKSSLKVV